MGKLGKRMCQKAKEGLENIEKMREKFKKNAQKKCETHPPLCIANKSGFSQPLWR